MRGVTLAWVTFLGLATWRYEQTHPGTLPPPKTYVGSSVLFTLFGLLASPAPELATVLAWGLVVAGVTTGTGLPSAGGAITPAPVVAGATSLGRVGTGGRRVRSAPAGPSGPVGAGV